MRIKPPYSYFILHKQGNVCLNSFHLIVPIRCAVQRPKTVVMDATTSVDDSKTIKLKRDKPVGSSHFDCHNSFIYLIHDITFFMSPPKRTLPPAALFQLIDVPPSKIATARLIAIAKLARIKINCDWSQLKLHRN